MTDFTIRIPRISVAISESELTELLVDEGGHVTEGAPLFVIATDKAENEVAAGASGTVQWSGEVETVYEIGAEIGTIRTSG
ncbi:MULTISPECIES: lipoyl domain-containing protein [Pseudofrankia]|uniref:lipoyl domain-containing protein n=1 Tax=Pseudofrankia TaxID=2994363 RepID=UPI000234D8C4|nr:MULTISPECIES: biotin/lipoyl-containing protein [Pseudofrankia]OHV30889.1 dihydrolipoamide acyltransferase [Pseudofrankia sp. EUN1h]